MQVCRSRSAQKSLFWSILRLPKFRLTYQPTDHGTPIELLIREESNPATKSVKGRQKERKKERGKVKKEERKKEREKERKKERNKG